MQRRVSMTRDPQQVALAIERLKALVPTGTPGVRDYLLDLIEVRRTEALGPNGQAQGIAALVDDIQRRLGTAQIVVEALDDPERILRMPEGIPALGVLEWLLRPALPLRGDDLEPPASGPWCGLSADVARTPARSVCRIDLAITGAEPFQLGSGFVAGRDDAGRLLVMTNAHVAREALSQGWRSVHGLEARCDFGKSLMELHDAWVAVESCSIHPAHDLALLALAGDHLTNGEEVPPALTVGCAPPEPTLGRTIGVLGHPSFDSRRDPFPKLYGFGDAFGVKRFSPGHIRAVERRPWGPAEVDVVLHDAATLSGSSGSCVLDLASGVVLALHFGGWPLSAQQVQVGGQQMIARLFEANGGVPLWQLRQDPVLAGVRFVE